MSGVLVVGVGAVVAFGIYLFVPFHPGQDILDMVTKGAKLAGGVAQVFEDARRAPGTNEVRALGCDEAMALDMNAFFAASNPSDAGPPLPTTPPKVPLMVVCSMSHYAAPPDCDDVARAYVSGAGAPPDTFAAVGVMLHRNPSDYCSMEYDSSGARIGRMPGLIPVVPPSSSSP